MKNKTAIFYKSRYGSTQKYAEWLSQELACSVLDKGSSIADYETIIYGGGLYAGKINGISFINEHWSQLKNKNVAVFIVGLMKADSIDLGKIIDEHFTEEQREKIKFFYLRGAIDYKKLKRIHKIMMFGLVSALKKKNEEELSEDDKALIQTYGEELSYINKEKLRPILDYLNKE